MTQLLEMLVWLEVVTRTSFLSLIFQAFTKIAEYINYANKCEDIELIAGGTYDDSVGYYIQPTVYVTRDPNNKIMKVGRIYFIVECISEYVVYGISSFCMYLCLFSEFQCQNFKIKLFILL